MVVWRRVAQAAIVLAAVGGGRAAWAAGKVRLDLIAPDQSAAMTLHDWNDALGKAGIHGARLRSGEGGERPAIVNQGTAKEPFYVVTAMVLSRDELLLPGGRFRRGELGRLAQWLRDLAETGPVEGRESRGAFGLSVSQFEQVHNDLAKPVAFSTQGMARGQAVERIARQLQNAVRLDADAARQLDQDKIGEELSGVSSGTALAYILRPAGYCLVPQLAGAKVDLSVQKAKPALQIWPVGWPPKGEANKALPGLHEFLDVNVQNVSASDALAAIAARLKVPVLMDHNALARHGLDPTKAMVSLPQRRTTYSLALGKLLSQAGLKFEVRLDEADAPLLWVSSVKPM
jgi:hypothetical protein